MSQLSKNSPWVRWWVATSSDMSAITAGKRGTALKLSISHCKCCSECWLNSLLRDIKRSWMWDYIESQKQVEQKRAQLWCHDFGSLLEYNQWKRHIDREKKRKTRMGITRCNACVTCRTSSAQTLLKVCVCVCLCFTPVIPHDFLSLLTQYFFHAS